MDFPKSFVGGNATDMIGIQYSEKIVIDLHLKIQNNWILPDFHHSIQGLDLHIGNDEIDESDMHPMLFPLLLPHFQ